MTVFHTKLLSVLKIRGVPTIYIRIIAFWYKHQFLYVKWGNSISEGFTVTNGVRQGSVLSPYLFCLYINKISIELNNLKIGCKLGSVLINHLFYADDICLFSPSRKGLQLMLNVCYNYGLELDITFNKTKCKIMIFKSKSYKKCISPIFRMGEVTPVECFSNKYFGTFYNP